MLVSDFVHEGMPSSEFSECLFYPAASIAICRDSAQGANRVSGFLTQLAATVFVWLGRRKSLWVKRSRALV